MIKIGSPFVFGLLRNGEGHSTPDRPPHHPGQPPGAPPPEDPHPCPSPAPSAPPSPGEGARLMRTRFSSFSPGEGGGEGAGGEGRGGEGAGEEGRGDEGLGWGAASGGLIDSSIAEGLLQEILHFSSFRPFPQV